MCTMYYTQYLHILYYSFFFSRLICSNFSFFLSDTHTHIYIYIFIFHLSQKSNRIIFTPLSIHRVNPIEKFSRYVYYINIIMFPVYYIYSILYIHTIPIYYFFSRLICSFFLSFSLSMYTYKQYTVLYTTIPASVINKIRRNELIRMTINDAVRVRLIRRIELFG